MKTNRFLRLFPANHSFLVRYRLVLFPLVAIGSAVGPLLFKTPFNAPFYWAGRYLAIPIFIAVVGYTILNRRELIPMMRRPAKVYLLAILFIPILILCSAGWVDLVNGFCVAGTPTRYEGVIQDKFKSGARTRTWQIVIHDEAHNTSMVFNVSESLYTSLQVGNRYSRTMQVGCLGIPYERRF